MSYALYRPVIARAAVRPELWRLICGLTTVVLVTFVWATALLAALANLSGPQSLGEIGRFEGPTATVVFVAVIVGLGLGTWLAGLFWHRRGLASLVGRASRTVRDFTIAALITWSLAAALWLVSLPFSAPLEPNLPLRDWLRWLPLALFVILLQTGSEEILFRGYLQSQLAARFKRTWVWLLVPALSFGVLHYLPGSGAASGLVYVLVTTLFGLLAGDLTARTGSIGAAWGVHFANNCIAILLIVHLGAVSGLGLYSAGTIEDALVLSPVLAFDLILLFTVWLLTRRALAG